LSDPNRNRALYGLPALALLFCLELEFGVQTSRVYLFLFCNVAELEMLFFTLSEFGTGYFEQEQQQKSP
jgi:hypothetical protein